MKFAYADPPYLGSAARYANRNPKALDYNDPETHQRLLLELQAQYPDGWAISCGMGNLWELLPMIPKNWGCRIAAWCAPFGAQSARWVPKRCWEPVIFRGGRRRTRDDSPPDFLVANHPWAAHGHRRRNQHTPRNPGFPGAKPDEFCYWIFDLLNMRPGDTFVDLFPGTGRVGRAWEHYSRGGVQIFQGIGDPL